MPSRLHRTSAMERSYADFHKPSPWQRAKAAIKRARRLWLRGVLGSIVAAYFGWLATEVLPASRHLSCLAKEHFRKAAPGTQFTILIGNLADDPEGRQTELVRDVFLNQRGLDVRQTCRVVRLELASGSLADAKAAALKEGRALLARSNADLLIWGEVKKADRELSLWFLSSGSSTLGASSYSLTEKITLPESFRADLSAQLRAVALAQIAPATEQAGTYLVGLLTPVRAKLEQLLANPVPDLNDEQKTDLRFSLALAAQTIGEQTGQNAPLEAAEREYREVLSVWTRERVPLRLGQDPEQPRRRALDAGRAESGTERLEQAVAAYRAALEVYTRERVPLAWARTQNNLGAALSTLGERESGTERLEQAVAAYRAGPRGVHPRARPARLGHDPEQPRRRALDARRARERHRTSGAGGRRLSRRPRGVHPRARPARSGPRPSTTSAPRSRRSASGREAPNVWSRRSPPIAPPSRSGPVSASRSTGP